MKNIERHRLNNNWTYAQKLWSQKQQQHNLIGWKLQLGHMGDKVGLCSYYDRTIYLSSVFMRGASCNYKKVRKSLLHEIAHVLTPGHSHNTVWKKKCQKIGGDDRLAATMDLPGMNWAMYCRICKWRQEYLTKPNLINKICSGCRRPPSIKKII